MGSQVLILIYLLALLFTKHFIVDFLLQTKYQWSNKGKYAHPGGVLHSGLHGLATFGCLYWVTHGSAMYLAILDFTLHYHIDWLKVRINEKMGWGANTHEQFWWLLGFDQFLHSLTYILLVYAALSAIHI